MYSVYPLINATHQHKFFNLKYKYHVCKELLSKKKENSK